MILPGFPVLLGKGDPFVYPVITLTPGVTDVDPEIGFCVAGAGANVSGGRDPAGSISEEPIPGVTFRALLGGAGWRAFYFSAGFGAQVGDAFLINGTSTVYIAETGGLWGETYCQTDPGFSLTAGVPVTIQFLKLT